jgi:hypothetical protein
VDINFYPFTLTTWFHLLGKHNPDKVAKAQTKVTHAYFKGKNSTDKGKISLRPRKNKHYMKIPSFDKAITNP